MGDLFDQVEAELQRKYYGWAGKEQFKGTGDRLRRAAEEFCWPSKKIDEEVEKCFTAAFVDKYDEMLVSGPTSVQTLCPHHLMPCHLEVYIGYVPDQQVLGLSKFSRIAVLLGKRPVLQEMYSREIADVIMKKLKPLGVGVYVVGEHGCMKSRGILQDVPVSTSHLLGVIKDKPEARAEFFAQVKRRK